MGNLRDLATFKPIIGKSDYFLKPGNVSKNNYFKQEI